MIVIHCVSYFFWFDLWNLCQWKQSNSSTCSSKTESPASSLNRQWLYLLPTLQWIEKITRYWNFLKREQSNSVPVEYAITLKLKQKCKQHVWTAGYMTNYQHFLITVLCEVQLLRTGFKEYVHPLEHLGHTHSQEGYAQRSSRGWNIQFNAKLYRKRPWLRRSEEQRSKQQMPFAISGPVLVAGWLNAGWTEWGGGKKTWKSLWWKLFGVINPFWD